MIDVEDFKQQMDLFAAMRAKSDLPFQPYVTFDDGHISNFEYALPILQSRGMKAHFFITAGWTGDKPGYMGWQELRALHSAGQSIGAHGWSHALLTHCSDKELHVELNDSRKILENRLGASVTTMSLPGGRYNRRVLAACEEAGYTQVYTSIPRSEPASPGFTIGRLNIRKDMKLEWIADLFNSSQSALPRLERLYRIKAAAQMVIGDRMYERLWAVLNREEPDVQAAGVTRE